MQKLSSYELYLRKKKKNENCFFWVDIFFLQILLCGQTYSWRERYDILAFQLHATG